MTTEAPRWTQKAQEAYRAYRDCPRPRSLRRAAAFYYKGDADREPTAHQHRQFKEWSRRLGWVDRLEQELSEAADARFRETFLPRQTTKEADDEQERSQRSQRSYPVPGGRD